MSDIGVSFTCSQGLTNPAAVGMAKAWSDSSKSDIVTMIIMCFTDGRNPVI